MSVRIYLFVPGQHFLWRNSIPVNNGMLWGKAQYFHTERTLRARVRTDVCPDPLHTCYREQISMVSPGSIWCTKTSIQSPKLQFKRQQFPMRLLHMKVVMIWNMICTQALYQSVTPPISTRYMGSQRNAMITPNDSHGTIPVQGRLSSA